MPNELRRFNRRVNFTAASLWPLLHVAAAGFRAWDLLAGLAVMDGVVAFVALMWWVSGKMFRA